MMENGSFTSSPEVSPVSSIAPSDDVEVKKLKDLVKKLEKQNEHLRHRTGKLNSSANKLTRAQFEQSIAGGDAASSHALPKFKTVNGTSDDLKVFDDNDEDFLNVSMGDEFSWLYKSPKPSESNLKDSKSPLEWVNEEFEHPSTPQLASAKRNIMYKLDGAYGDRSSPDLSYLRRSIEKRLVFPVDDYKSDSPLKPTADETTTIPSTKSKSLEFNDMSSMPADAASEVQLSGSYDDEQERNSSSPDTSHHSHHLPVPSQTMTTAHGLYPAHVDVEDESHIRAHTPTRIELSKPAEKVEISPRSKSPARKGLSKGVTPTRKSLPNPSRLSQPSNSPSTTRNGLSHPSKHQSPHQPVIKSSLAAPSRVSRLQQKSGLPSPSASSGIPSAGRGIPGPRSASPMTSQRRSLPRPSQTTTSMKYSSKLASPRTTAKKTSPPPSTDVWGDDDEVY